MRGNGMIFREKTRIMGEESDMGNNIGVLVFGGVEIVIREFE